MPKQRKFTSAPRGLRGENTLNAKRVRRNPRHRHNLLTVPWGIHPFMIAPVLAGETLTNIQLTARAVSDPVKSPILGWTKEYHYFYVKLSQLDMLYNTGSDGGQNSTFGYFKQLVDPTVLPPTEGTDFQPYDVKSDAPNYVSNCMQLIVDQYFRDTGEILSDYVVAPISGLGNIALAQMNTPGWMDSADDEDNIPEETVDVNATPSPDNFTMSDWQKMYNEWVAARRNKTTELSVTEYFAQYGVKQAEGVDPMRPERLLSVRDWQYPANHVNPVDQVDPDDGTTIMVKAGKPTSALSWAIKREGNKRMFFKEHGFIVGITVARPKTYHKKQLQSAICLMRGILPWMPPTITDGDMAPEMSTAFVTGELSPITSDITNAVVDVKDLFVRGDDFINYRIDHPEHAGYHRGITDNYSATENNSNLKYPKAADIKNFFTYADPLQFIREDGATQLTILGTQVDLS